MKVISGQHRGRKLNTLEGLHTRPPLEMVRAAYFNRIGKAIEGKSFLDCFAGSGSVGIEAMSRGASQCTFIESFRKCSKIIEKNLTSLRIENGKIITQKIPEAFKPLLQKSQQFDYIFADPPFDMMMKGFHLNLPDALAPLLKQGGNLSIRYPEKAPFVPLGGPLKELETRKYGMSLIRQFALEKTEN